MATVHADMQSEADHETESEQSQSEASEDNSSVDSRANSADEEEADDVNDDDDKCDEDMEQDEEPTVWMALKQKAWRRKIQAKYEHHLKDLIDSGVDETKATKWAYDAILPQFQEAVQHYYMEQLMLIRKIREDRTHKKIRETYKRLIEEESYSRDEALRYAVKKRRYLIDKETGLLDNPMGGSSDEESDDGEQDGDNDGDVAFNRSGYRPYTSTL